MMIPHLNIMMDPMMILHLNIMMDPKPTNTYITEMKNLLSDLVANHIDTTVHVLPAFERVHNDTLIQRLTTSTKKLRITALVQKTLNS
jgi:hypothetical protein